MLLELWCTTKIAAKTLPLILLLY